MRTGRQIFEGGKRLEQSQNKIKKKTMISVTTSNVCCVSKVA
jgi:hypothetical protein